MTFMNKKEEILQFELTNYGRHLLSQGKLKPEFYAFYDDDILYDVGKANFTETAAETKSRILQETPYMRTQISYSDLDKKLYKFKPTSLNEEMAYPTLEGKVDKLVYPIGTSDPISGQNSPFWDIKFLEGDATTTKQISNQNASSLPFKTIPQIEFNPHYTLEVKNELYEDYDESFIDKTNPNFPLTRTSIDGTYISIKEESILLYILEKNGFKHNDSFEIEVFVEDDDNPLNMISLKFFDERRPLQPIVNGILQSEDENFLSFDPSFIEDIQDPSYVEHYFNFRIDSEIPEEDVCNGIKRLAVKDIFVDLEYDCLERDRFEASDISVYGSRITLDDIEDCE